MVLDNSQLFMNEEEMYDVNGGLSLGLKKTWQIPTALTVSLTSA